MANQSGKQITSSPSVGEEGSGNSRRSSVVNSRRSSVANSNISTDTAQGLAGSSRNIPSSVTGQSVTSKNTNRSRNSGETITNYGNAVPGGSGTSDRISAPASFADFVRNDFDNPHRSLSERLIGSDAGGSFVVEDQMALYKDLIQHYTDLFHYVHGERQAMSEEIAAAERSYVAVQNSVLHFSPAERQAVNMVLGNYAEKITEMKGRIEMFDAEIQPTRERIRDTLTFALHSVPLDMLMQIVQENQWPNENVCRDLDLPMDYTLMFRGTYRLPKRTGFQETGNNQANDDAAVRIKELEAMIQKLSMGSKVEVTPMMKEGEKPTTVLDDVKPEERKINYTERRKRTKFPRFSNGSASEAQQWMKHYEHLCDFVNYDDQDKVAELSVVLLDNALNWYLNVEKASWSEVKKAFLLQFGGGDDPALVALSELKKLHQGKMSMKQFGPLISDLLDRAQIYRPGVQIDYFKERINSELLRAVIYRGPRTLVDAINITTEVEEDLKRLAQGTTAPIVSSMNYGASSSGSSSTTAAEQQNYQGTGSYRRKKGYKHGSGGGPGGGSGSSRKDGGSDDSGSKGGYKKRESRSCYNCGSRGHLVRNCPGKEQAKHNAQRLVDIPEDDSEKMVDIFAHLGRLENNTQVTVNEESNKKYRFLKDVELENGDKQETLVDTGATVSSISWDTAIKLNLHTFVTPTKCIEYGSGVTQTTRNKAILKFSVDGISTRAFPYVVEKQNVEIILGMDWMVHEDWALRPRTKDLFKITESQNVQAIQTSEEKLTEEILKEFPSLIPNEDEVQTVTNAPYKHRILTGDALPVNVRDYRRPYAETLQIKKEVAEMLRKEVIEPSTSAWCSPVVLIKKGDHDQAARDGTPPQWRFCVDYRKLNAITVKDKFPIGNLNELLDQLHGCKYLSTIDLKAGYWQIPMDPRDAPKTAFIADGALYQFRVLPFGCVTAPNAFSRFMAGVMRGLRRSKVYLDDIIVFSPSLEAHKEDLRAVLSRLVEYNLKISVKKCKFFRREVEYLGFIVSDQGIRSNPAKVQVIKDWKAPTTVSALQRFLGFCAFYHRFIRNLAQMAAPLYKLLRKDIHFEWSKEANQAFEDLKKTLMTLPTLAYPDPTKPYDVHTDASMHGLGAVIVQDGRPIAFASRTLTPAEKNYSTTEQEALCVVYALKHFYPYLYGAQLTIYTDHAALKSILSVKEPRGRIARWILAIQGYSFTIIHRKGILNADADALSRKDQVNSQAIQNGDAQPTFQRGDGAVQRLSGLLHLKNEQLKDATVKAILKEGVKHPFSFQDGLLWYKYEDATMVPVTPQSMVKSLIRSVHSLPTGGHFATDKTLAKVRLMGWWSSMSDDVKNWVKNCDPCQRYKIRNDSAVPPLKPIVPSRLGEIWALDIAMLPLSKAGNRYLLVMCEYLSKWTITVALPSYDTDHIAQAILYELVLKFSVPSRLITDNGASLVGDAMNQVCARLGIKRSLTSVEHPQTDGLVERMNRTLKTSLAAAVHTEPTSWDTYLQFITFAYNTAKHASTGFSPFHILFGRHPVLPNEEGLIIPEFKTYETETWVNYLNKYIPLLHGKVLKNIKVAQGYQKTFYDKGRRVKYDYKVGDLILRKNLEKTTFPKELWSGPYEIVSKNNEEGTSWKIVKKGDPRSYVTTANVRHMRPYYQDSNAADKSSTLFEEETM